MYRIEKKICGGKNFVLFFNRHLYDRHLYDSQFNFLIKISPHEKIVLYIRYNVNNVLI